jgi:hypothetical protein
MKSNEVWQEILERNNLPTFLTLFNKLNSLHRHDNAQNYRIQRKMVQRLSNITYNFALSSYLRASSVKIMIQITIAGMPMIFYCVRLYLSKCNGTCIVSVKQNMDFNFQPHSTYVFLIFHQKKKALLKVVNPLKIHQYTKFHGPTLTGASFASTSEVLTELNKIY